MASSSAASSRRPTIEELRRGGAEELEEEEDDEISDWSSLASIKAANSLITKQAAAAAVKHTSLKPKSSTSSATKASSLAAASNTSWSSLNNMGYDEEDFMDAFRVFDTNGDGRITAKELNHVLRGLGIKMSSNEVKKMINELDK